MKQRHRARAKRLSEKHAVEMSNELMKQQLDRDRLNDKQVKDAENRALQESLKVGAVFF